MNPGTLRTLEFDRIVSVVAGLAATPLGQRRVAGLAPSAEPGAVAAAQRATSEAVRFLTDHPGFPLRAPSQLESILEALAIEGRPLEPLQLLGLGEYLESIEQTRQAIVGAGPSFPTLVGLAAGASPFTREIADIRRAIEPSGEVADHASPALASIRDRLRRQKSRLRSTLDAFIRARETSRYLQDQVVTDRNGRYVLVVRAEHRAAIPGIVHGGSASGASLFIEPLETVDINNEIVALEEQEAEEIRRILLALTDAFRLRAGELERTIDIATELDAIQARGRFSLIVNGIEPEVSADGSLELRGARHPLLIQAVRERARSDGDAGPGDAGPRSPVPVDIRLLPPTRVLIIAGPNTGGKTVALKTAGLLAAMAQSGLHIPADRGSRLPVFRSIFADIGDEQSISASLSTFSAHVTNLVAMDRALQLPALVLLDEVGAGTDPVEGGALGMAVIDHFRRRGAHLIATTHHDSLKSYASTTEGVEGAAFGFDPETFAPTYRLLYGTPGRSLAIEMAARLGLPASVIAAARRNLTGREQQLSEHLARIDDELRALDRERKQVGRERAAVAEAERRLRSKEDALREREEALRRRLDAGLDKQLREARREIDRVIEQLKARVAALAERADRRMPVSTGETGTARTEAHAAVEDVVARLRAGAGARQAAESGNPAAPRTALTPGTRVLVGPLGVEGAIVTLLDREVEVDVRGKRLRVPIADVRASGTPHEPAGHGSRAAPVGRGRTASQPGSVKVTVHLQPRPDTNPELNLIGNTVDEALDRLEKFLDQSSMTDVRELRIVHGHGTGQLRRAVAEFLKHHPLVAHFEPARQEQGGGGATIVALRD